MLMLKFDARSFFNRQLPLMFLDKTNSRSTTAITALSLKTYFFKLGSDVSGVELLQLEYNKALCNAHGERTLRRLVISVIKL